MMETYSKDLAEKAHRIKWVFTDVDGSLTDGRVFYSSAGEAMKAFSMRDGTGFFLLRKAGVHIGIITGENSPIVKQRAEKLKVDALFMGVENKFETISLWAKENHVSLDEIAYLGDDLNDIKLMQSCGLSFAVADACDYAKSVVDQVLTKNGGNGAFREMAEFIISAKNYFIEEIVSRYL